MGWEGVSTWTWLWISRHAPKAEKCEGEHPPEIRMQVTFLYGVLGRLCVMAAAAWFLLWEVRQSTEA